METIKVTSSSIPSISPKSSPSHSVYKVYDSQQRETKENGGNPKIGWTADPETTGGNETTSTVEISISCRKLSNRDISSRTSVFCMISNKPPGLKTWSELMRTESIHGDMNPDFASKERVTIDYYFGRVESLRFDVYHMEQKLTTKKSLGYVELNLGKIVKAGSAGLTTDLLSDNQQHSDDLACASVAQSRTCAATLILTAEELSCERHEVSLSLTGNSIGSWSWAGFCLPPKSMYVISKMTFHDEKYLVVYRSPVSSCHGRNPKWPTLKMSSRSLCNGDLERALKIDIFQKMYFTGHLTLVGSLWTTLDKLMTTSPTESIPLAGRNGETQKSALRVTSCEMTPIHTFLDYLGTGMQIHCCFAIDFTCSNGPPDDLESLHYQSNQPNQPNPYQQAIQAVGSILDNYDTSSYYPTFGFGARIPPVGEISYNFNVNLSEMSPNCSSVNGVLEAYSECMTKIELYGPTYFVPVIKTVAGMAKQSRCGENYYILVIITDGVITDLELTKKAIVEASVLPLSIIIIGVGEADFDSMEELDGDAVRLSYKGKQAERDIVQFVAYRSATAWMRTTGEDTTTTMAASKDGEKDRKFGAEKSQGVNEGSEEERQEKRDKAELLLAQSQLAQEVLAEVPIQLTEYMKSKGIVPSMIKPPPKVDMVTVTKAAMVAKKKWRAKVQEAKQ